MHTLDFELCFVSSLYLFFFLSLSLPYLIFFFTILLLAVKFLDCAAFYFYSIRTNGERINKRSILDSIQKPQIDNIFGSLFYLCFSQVRKIVCTVTKAKEIQDTWPITLWWKAMRNASSGISPGTMACSRWRRLSNME